MLNKLFSCRLGELPVSIHQPVSGKSLTAPQQQIATDNRNYHFSFAEFTHGLFKTRVYQFESFIREKYTWISDSMITLRMGNAHSYIFQLPYLGKQVFHQRDFNLLHIPHHSIEFTLAPAEKVSFMDIIISPDYLHTLEEDYPQLLDGFLQKTQRGLTAKLKTHNSIASIEVLRWIDKLIQPAATQSAPSTEAIVDNVIQSCFTVMSEHPGRRTTRLNLPDVNTLYRVASYLEESDEKVSIPELAQTFNISTYKLRKGFKEIFGYSVLHHPLEEKMRLATKLIEDKRYNNKQVAGMLGYRDPQSFSRAFKNRFGYCPYRNAQKM
jgi:AraC-like DNA-binding protein